MSKLASIQGKDVDFVEEFQRRAEVMAHQCRNAYIPKTQVEEFMQFCRGPFRVPYQNRDWLKRRLIQSQRWAALHKEWFTILSEIEEWTKDETLLKRPRYLAIFLAMVRNYMSFLEEGDFQNTHQY